MNKKVKYQLISLKLINGREPHSTNYVDLEHDQRFEQRQMDLGQRQRKIEIWEEERRNAWGIEGADSEVRERGEMR